MNRILFERSEFRPDGSVVFGGERASHGMGVLHGEPGQTLKTGEVGGKIGSSTITAIEDLGLDAEGKKSWRITVECRHDSDPLPPWCDLVLAPPRPRVMKRLLPQLATLGVRRIFLVGAEKVEKAFWGAQLLKEEIYRPLLVDGLMQGAVSTALPTINTRRNFRHWLEKGGFDADFANQPFRVVAHPPKQVGVDHPQDGLAHSDTCALSHSNTESVCEFDGGAVSQLNSLKGIVPIFAIGPEGGWTDDEVALLESRGFLRRGLGPRILKTETATVALLADFLG